jgi:hypothetical protein
MKLLEKLKKKKKKKEGIKAGYLIFTHNHRYLFQIILSISVNLNNTPGIIQYTKFTWEW